MKTTTFTLKLDGSIMSLHGVVDFLIRHQHVAAVKIDYAANTVTCDLFRRRLATALLCMRTLRVEYAEHE